MCGIAGWFNQQPNTSEQQQELDAMVTAIAHRGPDGRGSQLWSHAALGHSRLAIIDLDSGQQPMNSHDQRFSIVFNGEIYNYRQLRAELIEQGHHFNTHSDTEVILEIYRTRGWQGFNQLRGMFAFALWDHKVEQGTLARDSLGIKPLFIHQDQQQLSFASEAKALLARQEIDNQLDGNSLHLLLNFRYLPGQHTLFKGITQLSAGEVIEWRPSGIHHHQLTPDTPPHSVSTLDVFSQSVEAHFTADVEVGAYLSGGLDSASIVALGRQFSPGRLRTFTIRAGDDPNEAHYAARSAELLDVTNIQAEIKTDLAKQLPQLVWHLETPKINALQVSLLAQMTAKEVKVALSGLGGDELFLGYNAHKIMLQAQQAAHYLPRFITASLGTIGAKAISLLQKPVWSEPERAMHMLQSLGDWPQVYGLLRNVWDHPQLREKIYGPRMLDSRLENAFDFIRDQWPTRREPLLAMAEFEFRNKMVNDLLWQDDRVSMAAGLEVRVPFVDTHFAHHVQAIPRQQLMPHNRPKGYMREILKPLLPDEIFKRPKSGFQVSSPDFYHQHLKPLADHYLNETLVEKYGLFNPRFIKHVLGLPTNKGMRWHYFMLYFMLLTHIWLELFETPDSAHVAISTK